MNGTNAYIIIKRRDFLRSHRINCNDYITKMVKMRVTVTLFFKLMAGLRVILP